MNRMMVSQEQKSCSGRDEIFLFRLSMFLGLCIIFGAHPIVCAYGQGVPPLFSASPGNNLKDVTPAQSRVLARLRKLPTTSSIERIDVDLTALSSSTLSLAMGVGGGDTEVAHKTNGDIRNAKNFSWVGNLADRMGGQSAFVVRNGEVTGSIISPKGLSRIIPIGGGAQVLVGVDSSKFPKDEPESFRATQGRTIPLSVGSRSVADAAKKDDLTEIDVMVAYTPAAKAAVGNIDATIALAILEANQSYTQSGISIKLNLVDSFQAVYVEQGKSFEAILEDFTKMEDVKKRRDASGADLSALIIDKADFCGLADAILSDASTAFAVVYQDCATGYFSFAHELGHLMGARHDPQTDPTNSPFAYGHGYRHDGPGEGWRTIMSYDCQPSCTRLQYWSNPDIQYGGLPMGSADVSNNTRVLNETAATVANFRARPSHNH